MFSKEETLQLKKLFWISFAERYSRKWLLYNTKIKDFTFKFFIDNRKAQVIIDIESKDDFKRMAYYEKLQSLKTILNEEFIKDLVFEKNFYLDNGKVISRIWIEKIDVSLNNKNDWYNIFDFFYYNMDLLEKFYQEYDEYIKAI